MNDYVVLIELGKNSLKGIDHHSWLEKNEQAFGYLKNLNEIIPPQQHKKFRTKFFNDKKQYYKKLLNLINTLPTWEKAADLINLLYDKKVIDPYSKEAIEFNNLVFKRYFPN